MKEKTITRKKKKTKKEIPVFDIALSFSGEDREYVEKVASELKEMGFRVFYDKYEAISFWGKDLYEYLQEIYSERARYTVMFISKYYARKLWTNHERKSAQARAFLENREYILPARFDRTKIPGLLPTIAYIDLKNYKPETFAELIKTKIGPVKRTEFFPDRPDRLYGHLKFMKLDENTIDFLARKLFEVFKLMEPFERKVLFIAAMNSCPGGLLEKNIHINFDLLSRLVKRSKEELISLFSRLDCFDLFTRIYDEIDDSADIDQITKSRKVIRIEYRPSFEAFEGNATNVLSAIFDCMDENLCSECAENAIEKIDFSILSTKAGFPEK